MTSEPLLPLRYTSSSREAPSFLHFGAGGFALHLGPHSTLSGYRSRENFFKPSKWWAHQHRELEDPRLFEGLPWLDMSHLADTEEGQRHAVLGPMVGVNLKPGERETLRGLQESIFAGGGLEGDFNAYFKMALAHEVSGDKKPGPLDKVSIAEYCALWKALGAYVGTIQAGCFVEVDDPPDLPINMRYIRVWLADGDIIETNINGTRREIFDYYIGNPFASINETTRTAMCVEFLD